MKALECVRDNIIMTSCSNIDMVCPTQGHFSAMTIISFSFKYEITEPYITISISHLLSQLGIVKATAHLEISGKRLQNKFRMSKKLQ